MVIEAHDFVESVSQRPVERRSQSFGFRFHCFNRRADLQITRSTALDEHSKPSRSELRVLAVPLQRVADQQVILDIARKKLVALVADSSSHRGLRESDCAAASLLPSLYVAQSLAHKRGAQLEEQFPVGFVGVVGANANKGRQCLAECGRQRHYASGGSSSGGASSRVLSVPAKR